MKRKLIIIGIVAVAVLSLIGGGFALNGFFGGGGSIPDDTFTLGLVGYWNFDEGVGQTLNDASNSNNDGTRGATSGESTDDPAWVVAKPGNGSALDFEGTTDLVDTNYNASLTTQTYSVWVTADTQGEASLGRIFDKRGASDVTQLYWDTTNTLAFEQCFSVACGIWYFPAGALPIDGTWHYVVVTYDNSSTANDPLLYIDGVSQTVTEDQAPNGTLSTTANDYFVGNRSGGDRTWDGKIDELRIYNRELSAAEVQFHYSRGAPVAHWKFDEGAGSYAYNNAEISPNLVHNLIAYWPMEDNVSGNGQRVADSSGNERDATTDDGANNTGMDCTVSGNIDRGCDFDGTDDQIDVADNDLFSFGNGSSDSPFTFAFWINLDDATDAGYFAKGDEYRINGLDTDVVEYILVDDSSDGEIGITTTGSLTADENTWIHLAFTYDGSGASTGMAMYRNGSVFPATASDFGSYTAMENTANDVEIGSAIGLFGDGTMDEVRIYDRVLSPIEISQLANQAQRGTELTLDSSPSWATGQYGTALDFDGGADYAFAPDNAQLDFSDTADITISGWFNRDTATTDDVILAKRNSFNTASDAGYIAYLDSSNDNLLFEVSDGTDEYTLTSSASFTTAGWNHFAIVWDQDSAANSELYINGRADSATDAGTIGDIGSLANAVEFRIAAESDGASFFDGKLDDLRIYNYVRTEDEIRLDYNAGFAAKFGGSPADWITLGLQGYWNFEEGSGQTAGDKSGNGNDATLGATSAASSDDPSWSIGKAGNGGALDFDGSADHVAMASSTSLFILGDVTLSAWVFRDTSSGDDVIIDYEGVTDAEADNQPYEVWIDTNDILNFQWETGAGTNVTEQSSVAVSVPTGSWVYYTFTRDVTANEVKFYENGLQIGSTQTYTDDPTGGTNGTPTIGAYTGGTGEFDGKIDDVRIYNRVLSAEEVRYLYNQGGPVAHWKFEEGSGSTAFDSAGSSDGTIVEAAYVAGQYGTALDFAGTDPSVIILAADPTDFDVGLKNAATFSAWINADGAGEGTGGQIFLKAAATWLRVDTLSGGKLDLQVSMDLATTDATLNVSQVITQDQWHHVAMIYEDDTDDEISIYVDGRLVGTSSDGVGSPAADVGGAWTIGGQDTNNFDGTIDDFRVYSYARSADEIQVDYNAGFAAKFGGSPADWITLGLLGYWNFEEGSGKTANDSSGNGNHGTLEPQSIAYIQQKIAQLDTGDPDPGFFGSLKRKIISFLAGDAIANAEPSKEPAQYMYLAQWNLEYRDEMAKWYWTPPHRDMLVGSLDLRNSGQYDPAKGPQGYGFFVYREPIQDASFVYLGDSFSSNLSASQKQAVAQLLHIQEPIQADSLDSILWDIVTVHADPTGQARVKPLMPSNSLKLELYVGGEGLVQSKQLVPFESPEWENVLLVLQESYRKIRSQVQTGLLPQGQHQKALTVWMEQYGIADHTVFIPEDLPAEDPLPHETVIAETWGCADSDDLDCDLNWTEISDVGNLTDWDIVSNAASLQTTGFSRLTRPAKAVTNLSSADQYAEVDVVTLNAPTSGNTAAGAAVRVATSDTSGDYYVAGLNVPGSGSESAITAKISGNTFTELGTATTGLTLSLPDTIRIEVEGSTIRRYYNGNLQDTTTDTDITGNLQTGIAGSIAGSGSGGSADDSAVDNFEAGDLGLPPVWASGKAGNGGALNFDGVSSNVAVGDISATAQTITFWMNPDDNASRPIMGIDGTDVIEFDGSGNILATSFPAATVYVDGVTASSTATSTWQFVAITDSTGVSPTDLDIGSFETGGTREYFDGIIDEVRIYNRVLPAEQIRYLYNQGGPVAHWKFEEGSGSTAFDSFGSNDGTLTAMEEADWIIGQFGTALDFGGTDEFVNVGDIGSTAARTLSFWAKPQDTTEQFIELSASDSVEVSAGVVTPTGFGTETVYVDGVQTTSFPDDANWHHVVVVSDVDITADTVELGRVGATHYVGQMDDVRAYNYARSADEVSQDYNAGLSTHFR